MATEVEESILWKEGQVLACLGICRTTRWQLEQNGELKPIRIGRSLRYRKTDVLAYIDRLAKQQHGGAK